MVDREVLDRLDGDDGDSSDSSSSSDSGSGRSGGGGVNAEPYSMGDGERVNPDDVTVHNEADSIADPDLNYDKGASTLREYKKLQIEEVKELHRDMYQTSKQYGNAIDEFVLVLQAMLMTYAQNRTGIAMTIQGEFGKSKDDSIKITNEICKKAGEPKTFEKIVALLTDRFMD